MPSLAAVCNVFEEQNAIHGWLESASQWADELLCYHTGPGGAYSQDGTIETIEKWGARLEFGDIHAGFGVVRTEAVRLSSCEWVAILDADERLHPFVPVLTCAGEEAYPAVPEPKLQVSSTGEVTGQQAFLRELIADENLDAIQTHRRHWFDFSWRRPCQNWEHIPDFQLRILRNNGHIGYRPKPAMHEQVVDFRTNDLPRHIIATIYHDHYHCFFKVMEPEQRQADIAVYNAIHAGSVPPGDCNAQ